MRARLLALSLAAGGLALAAPAASAAPPPTPPADATMSIRIVTRGITDHHKLWLLDGDRLVVRGTITPFVSGQNVVLKLFRGGKQVGTRKAEVKAGQGGAGSYT